MDHIFRIGTSIHYLFFLILSGLIISVWVLAARSWVQYSKRILNAENEEHKKVCIRTYKRPLIISIFAPIITLVLLLGYGPGRVSLQSESGESIGHVKMLQKVPNENIDSVRAITEGNKPESLKRQETSDFSKEKKDADKYLKSLGLE